MSETFDYLIVGAGSAGCVIANRLTLAGDATVCVFEAGPRDTNPLIHIPAGFMKTVVDPALNWLYETEPIEGTAGRRIAQPRGKTLGGSGSISGHVYNRGQRLDYDTWAQMGNRGSGYRAECGHREEPMRTSNPAKVPGGTLCLAFKTIRVPQLQGRAASRAGPASR